MTVSINRNTAIEVDQYETPALHNLDIYKRVLVAVETKLEAERLALEEARCEIQRQEQLVNQGQPEKLFKGTPTFNKGCVRNLIGI